MMNSFMNGPLTAIKIKRTDSALVKFTEEGIRFSLLYAKQIIQESRFSRGVTSWHKKPRFISIITHCAAMKVN